MADKKAARRSKTAKKASKKKASAGTQSFSYQKRKVEIHETEDTCEVVIDGEHMHVEKLGPGRYHSHVIMFQDYDSLEALVKDVIDKEGELWFSAERRRKMTGGHGHDDQ